MISLRFWGMKGIALVALLLIAGTLTLTGCGGRRSEQARSLGDTNFILKKYDEAKAEYTRALEIDPKNALAHVGLARCAVIDGEIDEAIKEYKAAVDADPSLNSAYIEAAQTLINTDRAVDAEALATDYQSKNAERGGELLALVYFSTKRESQALELLKGLAQQFPASDEIRLDLALANLLAGDPIVAQTDLTAFVEGKGESSISGWMLLAEAAKRNGKSAELEARFREILKIKPNDSAIRLSLAATLVDLGQLDEAEKTIREYIEDPLHQAWAAYVMGKLEIARGDLPKAVPVLQLAARSLADQPLVGIVFRSAASEAGISLVSKPKEGAKPAADATPTTDSAASQAPIVPVPSEAKASTWQELWDKADLAELVRRRDEFMADGDTRVLETITLAALFVGDAQSMQAMTEKLPKTSPVLAYSVAMQNLHGGARDEAAMAALRSSLDQWKEQEPDRIVLRENAEGFALGRLGIRAQAFSRFVASLGQRPANSVPLFNLAVMYRNAQMPEFAVGCLRKLILLHSDAKEARYFLYRVLDEAGDIDEARRQAEATYGLMSNEPQAILDLASVYLKTGEGDLAVDLLKQGTQRLPKNELLKLLLASVLLSRDELDACMAQLDALPADFTMVAQASEVRTIALARKKDWAAVETQLGAKTGADLPQTMRFLKSAIAIRAGKLAEVDSILVVEERAPNDFKRTAALIRTAAGAADERLDARDTDLAAQLKSNPEAAANVATAFAFSRANFHKGAYELLVEANTQIGNNARLVSYALASLSRAVQIPDRAALAKTLVDSQPPNAQLLSDLSGVYASTKDTVAEREMLDKAIELAPENVDAWFRLAGLAERLKDTTLALRANERLLELNPKNPGVQNNVAYYLLQSNGDTAKALQYAQAAVEQLKSNPSAIHTLGLALMKSGDLPGARRNLFLALELRPGDPTVMLDTGLLLVQEKQVDDGKRYLEQSLMYADQLGIDFPRRAEAVAALEAAK